MYASENQMGHVFKVFSSLSILIACLGLFGLTTFAAERRKKEIGIRKAVGATVSQIVTILSKGLVKWMFIASLFAWPLAYFLMTQWLQRFAYRTHVGWQDLIIASSLSLLIALLTVSYQTIKAATANPVDSLRYE
jgi:putative ABC transport system permease protein